MAIVEMNEISTFRFVALNWHTSCLNRWSIGHANKIMTSLDRYVFPVIGERYITEIKTFHLSEVIKKTASKGVYDVAIRLRQYLTKIMRFAVQQGIIHYNPALDLDGILEPVTTRHYPALPLKNLPELLTRIHYFDGPELIRLALELNLHVFLRASELRLARWDEINMQMRIWVIPEQRKSIAGVRFSERGTKMRDEHIVPLSSQVIILLQRIKNINTGSEFVFPGFIKANKPVSENTMSNALRKMRYDTKTDVCAHGFRTMACSALNESGRWSKDAIERQMGHKDRNTVRAAYMHKAEFLEARIEMMQWWSDYLDANRREYIPPYIYSRFDRFTAEN